MLERLKFLMKQAGLTDNRYTEALNPQNDFEPIANPKMAEMPKTPKGTELKLTNNLGKKKPSFISKTQTKSPYNPN